MLADFGVDVAGRFMVSHTHLCDWATHPYCKTPVEEIHRMSTANVFLALFGCVLGYYSGVSFRGFHPFKMLFGLFTAYLMWDFYQQKIGTLLIVTYAIGFAFSFGSPLRKVFNWFDDIKMSMMLRKARKNAEHQFHSYQSDNSDDTRQQAEDRNRQHQQAEEELKRAKEQFHRERDEFEKSKQKSEWGAGLNPTIYADACKILGVPEGATVEEYKKAYRHLSSLFHPDKFARYDGLLKEQAAENLKLVNVAWETVQKT